MTLAPSSSFWMRLACRLRSSLRLRRQRVNSRNSLWGRSGMKLGLIQAMLQQLGDPRASLTSVLRPGPLDEGRIDHHHGEPILALILREVVEVVDRFPVDAGALLLFRSSRL